MRLYDISVEWPRHERYALTDQIRRVSRAICANLAEAWLKRRYPRHFSSKLSDAASEAAEVLVWLDFAERCGYLASDVAEELRQTYRQLSGGLVKMMAHTEQWCIPPSRVGEAPETYGPFDSPTPSLLGS